MRSYFDPYNNKHPQGQAALLHAKRAVAIILVLGLVLRLIVAIAFPVTPQSDASWYVTTATMLAEGLGYREQGIPTAFWPVGWPAALAVAIAVLQSVPLAVIFINLASSAVIMLAMLWIGRDLRLPESATRLALLIYAVYPNHIVYAGLALSELYFTALLTLAMWMLLRRRIGISLLLVCGGLFGLAVLAKPQFVVVPAGALLLALFLPQRPTVLDAGRRLVVVYAVMAAVLAPWLVRNQQVFGEFVFVSTNGGVGLHIGANDDATGSHVELQETDAFAELGIPWQERVARQVELDRAHQSAAIAWIKSNPEKYVALMPVKLFKLWWKDTDGFWWYGYDYPDGILSIRVLQLLNQFIYATILLAAFVCFLRELIGLFSDRTAGGRFLLVFAILNSP